MDVGDARHQVGVRLRRWLILADDLTGAADCAAAFARRGLAASVAWGGGGAEAAVLALDLDSRRSGPEAAAAGHLAALGRHGGADRAVFKKIDSTLRGQPAAEIAAVARGLGGNALAIVAPAFPAMGRTTLGGAVRVHGGPLEDTALWAREGGCATAYLPSLLDGVGLRAAVAPLDVVRGGALAAAIGRLMAEGARAVVCDALTQADLDGIAAATRPWASGVFWAGSGGLASALAGLAGDGAAAARPAVVGGILVVVGSMAEASRAASVRLAADPGMVVERVGAGTLAGPEGAAWRAAGRRLAEALAEGGDALVEIAAEPGAGPAEGMALVRRLALLLRPALPGVGALVATGGETALAVLDAMGATSVQVLDEIEPGVPIGVMRGAAAAPVVTKAGAFGDAGTLLRCVADLRRRRLPRIRP